MRFAAKNQRDFVYAIVLCVIGMAGLWLGWDLPAGSAANFGPGFVPKILCASILAFGVVIAAKTLVVGGEPFGGFAWRQVIVIFVSIVAFGAIVTFAGLVLSVAILALLLQAAEHRRSSPWEAVVFSVSLSLVSSLLFGVILKINIPLLP